MSLKSYYQNMFVLVHSHKSYSLTELENMLPWEFDLVITQTNNWVKEENEKRQAKEQERQHSLKKMLSSQQGKKR